MGSWQKCKEKVFKKRKKINHKFCYFILLKLNHYIEGIKTKYILLTTGERRFIGIY